MKAYKFFSTLITVLLTVLYLVFVFSVSCMFSFLPWYDTDGFYMLNFALIWLPLCVLTLLQIIISVISKRFNKPTAMLLCLNALYIPIVFLLGFTDVSVSVFKTIGIIGIITMITYVVVFIKKFKTI